MTRVLDAFRRAFRARRKPARPLGMAPQDGDKSAWIRTVFTGNEVAPHDE